MNQQKTDITNHSLLHRLRFVLVETSRAGNVGSAARALKTMGFTDLVLVNPRFDNVLQDPEAVAFASGAQDILDNTRIVGSIEEALQGCNFAAAVSARLREFSPPVIDPRALSSKLAADTSLNAALIFGNERVGLPNALVQQCNMLINIPSNPDYSSLNLSQAVQVLAYECRMASLAAQENAIMTTQTDVGFEGQAASVTDIEGMFAHLETALVAIGFLNPDNPRKLMPRLKRLFSRAQLETEEVNILRGMARQMLTPKQGKKDE
jgi:tRNA/rRNA methyltransferase